MEVYSSFEEKNKFFKYGGMKIDNDEDFNNYTKWLVNMNKEDKFIFRGVGDAKYKLFNSAQRHWEMIASERDDEEEYTNFIREILKKCKEWNNGTVTNLLNTYGISDKNSLAYLAFLQHFGSPTPLIDFTKNIYNAIYFAIGNLSGFVEAETEIDNYFSVYFTYKNNTAYETFYETFRKARKEEPVGDFDYLNIAEHGIILISESDKEFQILNNVRIANQEGLFFFNNNCIEPIEVVYKEFVDLLLTKIDKKKMDELYIHEHFAGCYNFHKKYAGDMRNIVKDYGVTDSFIYPDISDLIKFVKQ